MKLTSKDVAQYWWGYDLGACDVLSSYYDTRTDWLDKTAAENYLKRYGLFDEKNEDWEAMKEKQEAIFYLDKRLPDMIFKKDFEFIGLLGGAIFEERDFNQFKSCLDKIGEKTFVVVQELFRYEAETIKHSLKMKYPADISWEELMSGNYISTILFEGYECDYYVFGESGEWGMYVSDEYYSEDYDGKTISPDGGPINIMGFSKEYRDIFRKGYEIPDGQYYENVDYLLEDEVEGEEDLNLELPNLKELVPPLYRSLHHN